MSIVLAASLISWCKKLNMRHDVLVSTSEVSENWIIPSRLLHAISLCKNNQEYFSPYSRGDLDQKLYCTVISFCRSIAYAERDASYLDFFGTTNTSTAASRTPGKTCSWAKMRRLEMPAIFMCLASHRHHRFELGETSSQANPREKKLPSQSKEKASPRSGRSSSSTTTMTSAHKWRSCRTQHQPATETYLQQAKAKPTDNSSKLWRAAHEPLLLP